MKEYRDVRAKYSFLEMCKQPEVASEVTVYAAHRLNVDAAIIFADILLIIEPMGLELEFAKGEGPVIHNPVRSAEDVESVREVEDVSSLDYVFEAIKITRRELRPDIPLIGFCGAPFTLASYICEGGGSKNYINTKRLMYTDPGAWHELMSRISRALSRYLNAQIGRGRAGRADFRLVGRRALARRLPRIRPAAHARSYTRRHTRRPRHTLRHGHRRAA